ncbi:MAG: ATP synthase F0 subunit C [Deltaproteobacteria bacterium]|nr:ATP synthase F0 subunit C [Deltaproteobacteria bacterium]
MRIRYMLTSLLSAAVCLLASSLAFAEEAAGAAAGEAISGVAMKALGSGLAIGIAALGGGIGMGIAISGAIAGTARNPNVSGKIFTLMILGLAIIESLVIYALIMALLLKP